jgi:hypothetical protein
MSRDGRRRVLSYEERVLWTTITKAIKPLRDAPVEAAIEPRLRRFSSNLPRRKNQ